MAIISYLPDVDEINGSRRGLTFDVSQAGPIVKRRPSPVNHQTNLRMVIRLYLRQTNAFYWNLTAGQKTNWGILAAAEGVTGPYGMTKWQAGCAMFFKIALNALIAGDGLYANHPPHNPVTPPTWLTVNRIDKDTIRVTFIPSAQWLQKRIYLRQSKPGPGFRNWNQYDSYIAEYSELSPGSPHDFKTHFQHLTGWHGRYWLGTQRTCGHRSAETQYDL